MNDSEATPQKCVPTGLGFWTAFESAIDAGPKSADLRVAIERCVTAGATWVALRAGAGGANDASLNDESIAAFEAADIDVYVWIFAYRNTSAIEIEHYRRWFVAGAKGAIINAEFPFESATADDARALVAGIRYAWIEAQAERKMRGLPVVAAEAFVAHAPPDYLGAGVGHALRDELVALDECCDSIMPQVYAFEHDDSGHRHHVDNVMRGYRRRGYDIDRVWCVGCTYRPKTRGEERTGEVDANGKPKMRPKPTPPMADEAQRVADDVIDFLKHPDVAGCQAPSLYSLDAISWINGPRDRVMSALAANRQPHPSDAPDTQPETPPAIRRSSYPRLHAVTPLRAGEGEHTPITTESEKDEPPEAA